jgi:hypothetical protein
MSRRAPHAAGTRKRRRPSRKKIACTCYICRGTEKDPRTVSAHVLRPRYTAVRLNATENFISHNLSAPLPANFSITPETHALLEAYDSYFATTFEDGDTPLYSSEEHSEAGVESAPEPSCTVQHLILMHLEWMSAFRNTGGSTIYQHIGHLMHPYGHVMGIYVGTI